VSFARLSSLADAIAWIDREIVSCLGAERVPLTELSGRVLAQDLAAASDNPPFDRAVADGSAVSARILSVPASIALSPSALRKPARPI
jgi:molybdopterin biosynthesis enzyme